MKVEESYVMCLLLGYILNLFTAKYLYIIWELYAILMALNYICNNQLAIFNLVICVDSKSVL